MKISLPRDTRADEALLSWLPGSGCWHTECGTAGGTVLTAPHGTAPHSPCSGDVCLYPRMRFLFGRPCQVNFLDSLRISSVERHVKEGSCFCSVLAFHYPLPPRTLSLPYWSGKGGFSVVNSKPVRAHLISWAISFITWAVTILQSIGLLLAINLKVSHLVLPRNNRSPCIHDYWLIHLFHRHLLITKDVPVPR